ncbi:solute carrier family 2 member 15b isoform X2 [Dunckerocampus dactyliophorus]|uniref:solute carrier family 2 member 15b isoform X2 n=1 Tax=Dunckerocampus dactyliophorus TaxID=161453 RepID=UPI002406E04F|nr:solute carrier family 2 member 15b isoform X2 [Dunckerocampus dactyliophorus]
MAEELLLLHDAKLSSHLTKSLLAVAFLSSFGSSMLYGFNLAVVNSPAQYIKAFYNETLREEYNWVPDDKHLTVLYSLTVSIFAIGGMIGALLVGKLVTKYGRKGTLVKSTVLVFLGGALMGLSRAWREPAMVIIGRFIVGVHSGISLSVVPMYLGEIAPKNLRGFLGLIPSIHICLGVFIAQVLGLQELLGKEEHWPLLMSLIVFPTLVQLVFLPWFPESPRYLLIEKGNVHATVAALKRFRARGNLQLEVEEMQEEQRSLSSIQTLSVCSLLMDRCVRWQVITVIVVNVGMQLSGIDAIWFYTNDIFRNAGIPDPNIQYTTVGTGAIEVISGTLGCFTIERVGRRPLMIGGYLFMALCCAGITMSVLFQLATGPYCYLIFCSICLGVAVYTIFIIPETKNKTFLEISTMFASKNDILEEELASDEHLKMSLMNGYGTGDHY